MIRTPPESVKDKVAAPCLTLDTPVQYLKGVGPRRSALFRRLGIHTVRDLIYHFPRRHEDRRSFKPIGSVTPGEKVTVRGRISGASIFRARTGTVILQVVVRDGTGTLVALWFNQPYMRRWFTIGSSLILYGTVDLAGKRVQMVVPEFEVLPDDAGEPPRSLHMGRVVPIYPATSGLHQREFRTAVAQALRALLPVLEDPIPKEILERQSLSSLAHALKGIHFPSAPQNLAQAQARLAFEELLYFQLALRIRRIALETRAGIAHEVKGDLIHRWKEKLPFQLTPGQEKAIEEIERDLAASHPMRRLLQGEVGSGKTVVATHAMVVAVQNGFQAAVLAPTEVLARQHALSLNQMLSPVDLPVGLLTSSSDEASRLQLAQEIRSGSIPVVVGTHALLEPWVSFHKLGLVVIDEQQKFGVDQRNALVAKGKNPDLLILTATPIPRTLALTLYGELEISTITERPAGRQPVRTLWMDSTRREEVYAFVRRELEAGRQAYVVCPRIGDRYGEEGLGTSAIRIHQEYQGFFTGYRVGLLHGRLGPADQKLLFTAFKRGEIHVLVATQIIEVGVDVPNATVMVIEGAQRFGLTQLHQLRGRVGRGTHESTCILLADPKEPATLERLKTFAEVSDAFRIAEEDLRLRGPGELLGKRQAGLPDLKCFQWASQGPWLERTKEEAKHLLTQDRGPSFFKSTPLGREVALRFPELVMGCA